MLNSINIGTSGLVGFSKELETISNNVANLNTPGFKGANSQFTALFDTGAEGASADGGAMGSNRGAGLGVMPPVINFAQGQVNQSSNALDVAIDGSGFFVLKNTAGATSYTRDGRFHFDDKRILVNTVGEHVQALSTDGVLKDVTIADVLTNPAKASSAITLSGVLSSADTLKTLSAVQVTDSAGASTSLTLELKNNTAVTPGSWLLTVKNGTAVVGSGEVLFLAAGQIDPAHSSVSVNFQPTGAAAMPLTITLAAGTTNPASGTSSLAVSNIDGYGLGQLTEATFDESGRLAISYSNGQKTTDQTLALAEFASTASLKQAAGTSYTSADPGAVRLGRADGGASTIKGQSLEDSNVDLSKQFSAIIITQRGYQAASELISTANQMLDTLMHMKG